LRRFLCTAKKKTLYNDQQNLQRETSLWNLGTCELQMAATNKQTTSPISSSGMGNFDLMLWTSQKKRIVKESGTPKSVEKISSKIEQD